MTIINRTRLSNIPVRGHVLPTHNGNALKRQFVTCSTLNNTLVRAAAHRYLRCLVETFVRHVWSSRLCRHWEPHDQLWRSSQTSLTLVCPTHTHTGTQRKNSAYFSLQPTKTKKTCTWVCGWLPVVCSSVWWRSGQWSNQALGFLCSKCPAAPRDQRCPNMEADGSKTKKNIHTDFQQQPQSITISLLASEISKEKSDKQTATRTPDLFQRHFEGNESCPVKSFPNSFVIQPSSVTVTC